MGVGETIRAAIEASEHSLELFATHAFAFAKGHQQTVDQLRASRPHIVLRAILQDPETRPEEERVKAKDSLASFKEAGWDVRLISTAPSATGMLVDRKLALVEDEYRFAVHEISSKEEVAAIITLVANLTAEPRNDVFVENLWLPNLPEVAPRIAIASAEAWDELIPRLAALPHELRTLHPRKFEELIAELLSREGFDVTLTPAKNDGGRDVLASRRFDDFSLGRILYYVECKHWSNSVGVAVVRALYGVVEADGVTGGMVVTTSSFTRGSLSFAKEKVPYRLLLRDQQALKLWLRRVTS